jgi:hypothetical protein
MNFHSCKFHLRIVVKEGRNNIYQILPNNLFCCNLIMYNWKISGRFLFLPDRDPDSDTSFDMYPVSELNPKPNSGFFLIISGALSLYTLVC